MLRHVLHKFVSYGGLALGVSGVVLAGEKVLEDLEKNQKRKDYIKWPEYFMAVAALSAERSKDPSRQVGACVVNTDNRIVGIGYNGMPIGCSDNLMPWGKTSEDKIQLKYTYVCHAEMNAIVQNFASMKGCTIYVTLFPCNECAKIIIQSGIKEVVYLCEKSGPEYEASRKMFDMAHVKYSQYQTEDRRKKIELNLNSEA